MIREIPEIKLILGGHEHFPFSCMIGDSLILKSGKNLQSIGVVDVIFQKEKVLFSWKMIKNIKMKGKSFIG